METPFCFGPCCFNQTSGLSQLSIIRETSEQCTIILAYEVVSVKKHSNLDKGGSDYETYVCFYSYYFDFSRFCLF